MKILILIILIITKSSLVFSANEQCNGNKTSKLMVTGSGPYSYEILNSSYQFKIDGSKDSFDGFIDKEAIKRLFMSCSPITAICLNQKSIKLDTGSIEVSFKISPDPSPKPQNIILSTNPPLPEKVKNCLKKKWSSLEMPTPSTETNAKLTIDFKSVRK